ncbi:3-oxo-tetronate kinase [Streptomyces griseiscabiei]|uniref:3-oxo-tetronate kinase n=3 Tax=Streptomyces griseiscabiei TaxID=2993540 RepID=A0ABU4L6A9_9ACTN|nr:3-oxo-tetronate kinase [Streptomyces griseiscabiei]MBZ3906223.1 four-carbon acid sugar kinase family protein [Streptomyces griseiscabiei]MDX2911218.1 four-carbon acid sugar kinase family protein [Streptomyces griseiscabiei]
MTIRLGAIADDFTGATDLANNLVRSGMRTTQVIGVPTVGTLKEFESDAVVVALKTRTAPVADAVRESVEAAKSLREAGAEQLYFKYCSTFDSTDEGNIGPVTDALLDLVGADYTVAAPAFPAVGRTVYQGHLFVGDRLLNESGMRSHPLTPMTDADLVRVLGRQTIHPVGLIAEATVLAGPEAVADELRRLRRDNGVRIAVLDAVSDADLVTLGSAVADLPLVTAGSGLALGLARGWSRRPSCEAQLLPPASGHAAVIAGSVSRATNAQVDEFIATGAPAVSLDLDRIASGVDVVPEVLDRSSRALGREPVLVYSTRSPAEVKAFQDLVGQQHAGELIESALARIAVGLVDLGVGALVVAGGETSGAVVHALAVDSLQIGAQIDPGVPWCATRRSGRTLHLALKSGNFGGADFFTRAFTQLDRKADT